MTQQNPGNDFEARGTRDENWLRERVELLWENHFADVARGFPITTRFGTRAQYRFGSICARNGKTIILVNQLFSDPFVPTFVVDGTLAHELAHYAHGFGSGLPRLYADPHRGGVVDKELEKRGLGELDRKADRWRETCWDAFYAERCGDIVERKTARTDAVAQRWNAFIHRPGARTTEDLQGRLELLTARFGYGHVPFDVEWLHATRRQTGISYWFAKSRIVKLHGLAADRCVPGVVVDFELAYWLARVAVGDKWEAIHRVLVMSDMAAVAEEALRWRRSAWTHFRNRHHPLG